MIITYNLMQSDKLNQRKCLHYKRKSSINHRLKTETLLDVIDLLEVTSLRAFGSLGRERGVIVLGGLGISPFDEAKAAASGEVNFEDLPDVCATGFEGEDFPPPLGKVAVTRGAETGDANSLEGLEETLLARRAVFATGADLSLCTCLTATASVGGLEGADS